MASNALVLGAAKSGTSGLYYDVKKGAERAFGCNYVGFFEPKTDADLERVWQSPMPVVCKILLGRLLALSQPLKSGFFEKTVFIVRDPRDNIISHYLWFAATRLAGAAPALQRRVYESLERKVDDPSSISVMALIDEIAPLVAKGKSLPDLCRKSAYAPADFLVADGSDRFILRYEDYVDGRHGAVNDYLGFDLVSDADGRGLNRIRRSASHGYWKDWFLPTDVAFFVGERRNALERLGYRDEPVDSAGRNIPAETSIAYVRRLAAAA